MSHVNAVDRLLAGSLSNKYALELFTSTTGFTVTELQHNVEETLNELHSTILLIQDEFKNYPNDSTNKYILTCVLLKTFMTQFDESCKIQLLTISNYFSHYTNLKHIRIVDCDVTDAMIKVICNSYTNPINTACQLELFDVSYNLLTDIGIKLISETIITFHCNTMRNIMLSANFITDLGVNELSKAIKLCDNLEFIDICAQQAKDNNNNSLYYAQSPITNCLPLLSSLIGKKYLKAIELFDCGILPHNNKLLLNQSHNIFKELLSTCLNLKVFQLGRSNMNNPILLNSLLNGLIFRGKITLKNKCFKELWPIFQQSRLTQDLTIGIVSKITLFLMDFYDDKFHLVLSENSFDSNTILPVLTKALSNKYFIVGRMDLTGNILSFEDIFCLGTAIAKNPKIHSMHFDVMEYKDGTKIGWNWADEISSLSDGTYFTKGSSKDLHRGGYIRADCSKIWWSTIANKQTHVCDPTGGDYS